MLLALAGAQAAVRYAAWAADARSTDAAVVAAVAKASACDAAFGIAAETIQIHGGTGFTWSHDAHWFFKRAKAAQLMFGTSDQHHAEIANQIGI
jgi:alkylation response protein AidB-like acyl-CoA dehydrogenase